MPAKPVPDLEPYVPPAQTKEKLDWAELEALDISRLDEPGGKEALAEQVLRFINENGFFYVTGHGLTDEQINRQYAIGKAFFQLPLEEKMKYLCNTAVGDFRGYKPRSVGDLSSRDNDERYNIPKFTPEHERPHPQLILDHYEEIKEFSLHIHNKILLPLLRLFAYVLEIDEEYLVNLHRYEAEGLEYLRYTQYYPRTPEEDQKLDNIWARGHTDYNTLTFLFYQPVAGLQVLNTDTNTWKYVKSEPGSIIVNVADALEFLSGCFLKSTVHRVVRPPRDQANKPRLGLIYFARPEAAVKMKPVKKWARARIAKDHRFRTGVVNHRETEIIAGVHQKYYD
ncbi:hypothetical protein VTN77DRAFT_9295 [Rasamsonia byssochlamydoides]|uniref:uncharacterized protein n=1 Tax=Rasamsonia byssochlamydoides TaxID=89139 RepID=UPI0037437D80